MQSAWVKCRDPGKPAELRVIAAFNRRDYFRDRFKLANEHNYTAALKAGIANNIFIPVYGLFAALAQLSSFWS